MKSFDKLLAGILVLIATVFMGMNWYLGSIEQESSRGYRVEAKRAAAAISRIGLEQVDVSKYPSIIKISRLEHIDEKRFFEGSEADYLIKEVDGIYYRFDYVTKEGIYRNRMVLAVNMSLAVMSAVIIAVIFFIRMRFMKPFHTLQEVPYELSKGNLVVPAKEKKSRYFGRFMWGIDLLREHLEQQKRTQMELQREKKTLILSISHDIKTPLSAIKLYAKALERNLYDSPQRQKEIAESIHAKADEIEGYVSQIVKASREDFLNLTVLNQEFYLSEAMKKIAVYYNQKLELLKIDFQIAKYADCLIKGDVERTVEVLQNMIENAIKYGDGHLIHVEFSDEEDCRLVTVINSGCTLSAAELPHIFDSFWRGSNAASCRGSGLGLYICRQLMNKMNGEIFARCENSVMYMTVVFQKA